MKRKLKVLSSFGLIFLVLILVLSNFIRSTVYATSEVSSATDTTTTSVTYTQMDTMTVTPGAGDYMVTFSTSIQKSTGASIQSVSLFVGGVQVTHTERLLDSEGSYDSGDIYVLPVVINAYIASVGASDAIEVKWKTDAGTATAHERTLTVQPVTAADMSQATATATDTTTSATDTQMASMTLTPGAGDYMVYFSGSMQNSVTGDTYISLYSNGVQIAHSERYLVTEESFPSTKYPVATHAYIAGIGASDVIEVKWRTSTGTATAYNRTLTVQKVTAGNMSQATSTTDATTTSATDTLMTNMTLTPGAGDYLIFFSSSLSNATAPTTLNASIYVNSVQQAHSERQVYVEGSHDTAPEDSFILATEAYATSVGASDVIEVKWRTSGGTVHAPKRTLTVMKLVTGPTATPTPTPAPMSEQGHWKLDEGHGQIVHNSGGTVNNGTLGSTSAVQTQDPSWVEESLCMTGMCLSFNSANSQYVNFSSNLDSVKSFGFWVRPTSTTTPFVVLNGTSGNASISVASGTISTGAGFVAPTVYVNGVVSSTITANVWQHVMVTTSTGINATNLVLGWVDTTYFNGFMDDVHSYSTTLTAAQVKTYYLAGLSGVSTENGVSAALGRGSSGGMLSNGLVGYWKMDENTGTTGYDSSGNGKTGTLGNGTAGYVPSWSSGKFGSGLNFDGTDDNISIGDHDIYSFGNGTSDIGFTASAWVYATNGISRYIVHKNSEWRLRLNTNGYVACSATDNSTTSDIGRTTGIALSTGAWHYVTCTYDGSGVNAGFKIYVDGIRSDTIDDPSGTSYIAMENLSTIVDVGTISVSSPSYVFSGKIDDVRIYNRALSAAEVRQLYSWAPGSKAEWNMDENVGQYAYDTSGSGNHGVLGSLSTAESTDPVWGTGKYGGAMKFDGVDDVAIVSDSDSLSYPYNTMSATAWVKRSGNPVASEWILLKGNSPWEYGMNIYTSGVIEADLWQSGGSSSNNLSSTTVVTDGRWHHVAMTTDGASMKMYIDGVLEKIDTTYVGVMSNTAASLYIGDRPEAANSFLDGSVDSVRLYDYALTAGQIVEDMNGGHPPAGSPVGSAAVHLKFDEMGGTTANNSGYVGSGANGTISGATWYSGGKSGGAISTATAANFINSGDQTFVDSAIGLTTGFWVKPVSLATNKALISKSNFSTQNSFGIVTDNSASDEIRVHIPTSVSDVGTYFLTSNLNLASDTWSYLNVIYNASESASTRVRVYKDGKEISGSVTGTLPDTMTTGTTSLLKVGASDSGSYTALNAVVDDVKIYPYALTYDQMLVDYNAKTAMTLGNLSTSSDGVTASNSASREFCVPGDTTTCSPPVGWWKFDENTGVEGASTRDSSGNGNNLTVTNYIPSFWGSGKYGSALHTLNADGITSRAQVLDPAGELLDFSDTQNYTLNVWVKLLQAENTDQVIYYKGGNADTETGYSLRVNSSNQFRCQYADANVGARDSAVSTTVTTDRLWHNVACVMDRTGTATGTIGLHVFVDGKLEGSDTTLTELTGVNARTIQIGETDATFEYEAYIDEVKVYNYARTPAQIAWDYNKGGPIAQYRFDECTGATAYNGAPTGSGVAAGNNGTITIGATGTYTSAGTCSSGTSTQSWNGGTTGKYSSALALDGTDDYAVVTAGAPLNTLSGAFSVSAWVNAATLDASYRRIVSMNHTTQNWFIENNGGTPGQILWSPGGTSGQSSTGAPLITTGIWYHIVMTNDRATAKLYINGIQRDSLSFTGTTATTGNIGIGADDNGSTPWSGRIDDVRIYNYALTAAQVKTVMNEGSAVRFGP